MNVPRGLESAVRFLLNECLPPVLRDSRTVMALPFRLLFGKRAALFLDFKDRAFTMSDAELRDLYAEVSVVQINDSGTDLAPAAIARICSELTGDTALDVGCGGGMLAGAMARTHRTSACDFLVSESTRQGYPMVAFHEAPLEALPFADTAFDTVTCTHTLEHVRDFAAALAELRRVAARRLIVVLPKERPYRYSFNLHLHFFPYRFTVVERLRSGAASTQWELTEIDGTWYYREDMPPIPATASVN